MKELIFLQDNDNSSIVCTNEGVSKEDVFFAISSYAVFYNREIIINGEIISFSGITVEDKIDKNEEYLVKLFQKVVLKPIQVNVKPTRAKRKTPNDFLQYFLETYEDKIGFPYPLDETKKLEYKTKLRTVMDKFYVAGFDEKAIIRYIKQYVIFGNYEGKSIYIDFILAPNTVSNYIMYLNGVRSIKDLWQNIDISISPSEKKKIRYLMNSNNWNILSDEEKLVCMKLYKIYDKIKFEELCQKYKFTNGFLSKVKVHQMIATDEKITVEELLNKNKHDNKYLYYEYLKEQIEELKRDR
jgi:hypothetical protein